MSEFAPHAASIAYLTRQAAYCRQKAEALGNGEDAQRLLIKARSFEDSIRCLLDSQKVRLASKPLPKPESRGFVKRGRQWLWEQTLVVGGRRGRR